MSRGFHQTVSISLLAASAALATPVGSAMAQAMGGGAAPHYFSMANYANSPLRAVTPVAAGNTLVPRAYATDGAANVLVINRLAALPAGQLTEFQSYVMSGSGGLVFHAYVLRPTVNPDEYNVVFDSGPLTVPTTILDQVAVYPVGPVTVMPGDVIAHYGQGIPLDIGVGTDTLLYPADLAPVAGQTFTVGLDYPYYPDAITPQPRVYSFGASVLTGSFGIKKFVDQLPGFGPATANNLGQYIPVAAADTTTYPGSDYYELAVVEYQEKMHTDLPPTILRGYVQLSTATVPGAQVPLTDLSGAPLLINGVQALAVDRPHYLGPALLATKNQPVRILFRNLLPTGHYDPMTGKRGGDLFLPVDTTVMGAGMGPGMNGMAEPDPQNPMCAMIPKPSGCYTENRATIHLHGGVNPWISDGTPHQWITPSGEITPYANGVSVQNVPDMPAPGAGAQTFYFTNQQSARLMFYHDHAWGITRLNVYAGEAAPYLIADDAEKGLVAAGTIPAAADTIPLVIQDKTFVPPMAQLMATDPLWDSARWGGEGQLWLPHVYSPTENPGDSTGLNAFGRWPYGPWFWPPTTNITHPPIANPYFDPACDATVQWCEPPTMPGVPFQSMGMEAYNDTPVVNGTVYPTTTVEPKTYRFRVLNAANDRFFNLQFYVADASGTEVALNAAEVAAAKLDPAGVFPTPDTAVSQPGPSWVQIGTEGGFLPAPVVIPPQPITWVTDPKLFNAGNVDKHSLLIAPAERADVIVDFSAYAGKTLILYNDAPAAFPARDSRYDYYTDNADQRANGGAPTTLPGYGPNTRTIMQIKVAANAPAAPFNLAALQTAFAHHADGSGVFESSQHPIIVGQAAYNSAYDTAFRSAAPNDGFARIQDFSLTFATLSGTPLTIPFGNKQIHDEMGAAFDKDYGRLSGNLGLEAPGAQAGAQAMILYPYVNPSSELIDGTNLPKATAAGIQVTPIATTTDGTQLWKITHNGVDTHPIHFHLFDVQLINRVGWDGVIRKPDANEIGWKDTVRVSPLEDTIVALRPLIPYVPFDLPNSVRPLNPMMPLGSTLMFNSTDANGNPTNPITNQLVNFGAEYVWHCHILSHEEMDMMRPISVAVPPRPATKLAAVVNPATKQAPASVTLTWTDNSLNESNFVVQRKTAATAWATLGTLAANVTTFTDKTYKAGTTYWYQVIARNTVGYPGGQYMQLSADAAPVLVGPPAGGTTLTVTQPLATSPVALNWTYVPGGDTTGFWVQRASDAAFTVGLVTYKLGNVSAYNNTSFKHKVTYYYRVVPVNQLGSGTPSNTVSFTTL
jgi:FtsP/CotA-like multicopper oxidase with cupredoxin domain